ncbi:MAG: cytochrome c3 family protein [Verrucomicrobiota bacterium]
MLKVFKFWNIWFVAVISLAASLTYSLNQESPEFVTPGEMSHGHHQIELACSVCHTPNQGVKQNACTQCHAEELKRVDDSHPVIKFKDPRNASRLEKIEATKCITCHKEHSPDTTLEMGVSLPTDYCVYCHDTIFEERETHQNLTFDTCATAGCHNFHDNTALYERFLADHLDEPDHKMSPKRKSRSYYDEQVAKSEGLPAPDAPTGAPMREEWVHSWEISSHAAAGVNCMDCHGDTSQGAEFWVEKPTHMSCVKCHQYENKSFQEGMHGMRVAQELSPMRPELARLDMKSNAAHKELNCISCHGGHNFDTQYAATQACMQCHDDEHSQNYLNSKHVMTWEKELTGDAPANTGVSCATCHMPRIEVNEFGTTVIRVDHNQNNTLRPNEKMIRTSCIDCHGLQFTINALADEALIERNFVGHPSVNIESLEWARQEKMRTEASRR